MNVRWSSVAMMLPGVLVLLALVLALASADAQTVERDGIDYITGGVGSDEMERLKAREREFNLKLVFTLVEGNYPVVMLFAPGPVVLAKLPRGSYVVEATYQDNTQTRRFEVRERMRTEYVRWPSNPETESHPRLRHRATRLAVETMPSLAPNTAARNQPVRSVRCRSLWRTAIFERLLAQTGDRRNG